jgi:hypothetical protein
VRALQACLKKTYNYFCIKKNVTGYHIARVLAHCMHRNNNLDCFIKTSQYFHINNTGYLLFIFYNFQASLNHRANACSCFATRRRKEPEQTGDRSFSGRRLRPVLKNNQRLRQSQPGLNLIRMKWVRCLESRKAISTAEERNDFLLRNPN